MNPFALSLNLLIILIPKIELNTLYVAGMAKRSSADDKFVHSTMYLTIIRSKDGIQFDSLF